MTTWDAGLGIRDYGTYFGDWIDVGRSSGGGGHRLRIFEKLHCFPPLWKLKY